MPGDGARCEGGAGVTPAGGDPCDRRPAAAGQRAQAALAGTRFADVRWVASTGSTNSDVMSLAHEGAPEGIVVVADHQTAGRGRRARTWVSPPGGSLLVSVLLRPPARVASSATMAVAVALAEAVEQATGVSPGLKWPNDLVISVEPGDRKLAGILAEADWPAGTTVSGGWRAPKPYERVAVVVGVGINVAWPDPAELADSAELADPAELSEVVRTAVALNWMAPPVDRVDLLVAFLRRLERRYGELVSDGAGGIVDEWRRRSATLGRQVRVDVGVDDVEGTALDVTPEGHLVVETLEGQIRTLAVGDVVHLRRE